MKKEKDERRENAKGCLLAGVGLFIVTSVYTSCEFILQGKEYYKTFYSKDDFFNGYDFLRFTLGIAVVSIIISGYLFLNKDDKKVKEELQRISEWFSSVFKSSKNK